MSEGEEALRTATVHMQKAQKFCGLANHQANSDGTCANVLRH